MKVERGKKPQPITVLILNICVWGPLLKGEREIEGTRRPTRKADDNEGLETPFPNCFVSFHLQLSQLIGTHHIVFVCPWKR